MSYLSVFSGVEAVSVAWQTLGWEPAMLAEIDPFCCWLFVGGQMAVAFTQNQEGDLLSGEIMQSLGTNSNATGRNAAKVAVAWTQELTASTDILGTLQRGGEGGRSDGVMTSQIAVRRLTPRECARLQGFPDDYTLVVYCGKLIAVEPRYRALGNSMAVPVMRWIGERIAAVHEIVSARRSS